MTKRRRSSGRHGNRAPRQKQLYLIFDDWSRGYTFREVSLPADPSHPTAVSGKVSAERLPPPFFRLEAERRLPRCFAYAFGTRIIAAHPVDPQSVGSIDAIPILDVHKRSMIFGPSLDDPVLPVFIPVDDTMLFALHGDCFQLLHRSPQGPPASPGDPMWSWSLIPDPPCTSMEVASYAVHPDGPSILVSTHGWLGPASTFAFHTEKLVWTYLGEWVLPFTGRAHFDSDLQIFVGLSKDTETLGHLCFCDKASLNICYDTEDELPAPAWKLCPEKLFSGNPGERHVSAALIYLGSKSKFCLVECIFFEDVGADYQVLEERAAPRRKVFVDEDDLGGGKRSRYMYRLTKFSLRYDRNGDLKPKSRCVRYYKVPKKASIELINYTPVAFWL